MITAVHTQKSLDALPWSEIQKLHKSLGLKAAPNARTRRDLQNNIVAAMPQSVVEPEQVAISLTCENCPLARRLGDDEDRYCCGLTDIITRGHWEAKTDCYEAVAAQVQSETIEPATEVAPQAIGTEIAQPEQASAPKAFCHPFRYRHDIHNGQHSFSSAMYGLCECLRCKAPKNNETDLSALVVHFENLAPEIVAANDNHEPPNRGDNGRGRVEMVMNQPVKIVGVPHAAKPRADDNFMSSMVKEDDESKAFYDMTYLLERQLKAQLAVEKTIIGSDEEAIALLELEKVDRDIEFYGRPTSEPQPSPVVIQLENQMSEFKKNVLSLFKITAFDPAILPVCDDEPELPAAQSESESEGTIHWHSPTAGTIVGKKGALRNFYLRKRNAFGHLEIMVIISSGFTAAEHKTPNVHHQRIRAAIEAGRTFDPKAFKDSPQFLAETEDYRNIGRIKEGTDGRWWAWVNGGITGQAFPYENLALKYLDRVVENQAQNQKVCAN